MVVNCLKMSGRYILQISLEIVVGSSLFGRATLFKYGQK